MQNFTLLANGLGEKDRAEAAKQFDSSIFEISSKEYVQRAVNPAEAIQYVFSDFSLVGFIRDNLLWATFITGIRQLWMWTKSERKGVSISGWIIDIEESYSLNVMLPNDPAHLEAMLEALPNFINNNESSMKNKIVSVYFDGDKNSIAMMIIGER